MTENRRLVLLGTIGIILSALLGWGAAIMVSRNNANDQLSQLSAMSQEVTMRNNEIMVYTGQKMTTSTIKQKALGTAGRMTTPAGFVFGADNASTTVDLYVDFGNKKSRDFLLMNRNSFTNLMERNKVSIVIHPVPQGSAFSAYAAEALAESSEGDTTQSWNLLMELMKTGTDLDTNKPDEIVGAVVKTSKEAGFPGISSRTVKSGHFSSWLLSVGNAPVLKNASGIPLMVVNGTTIDSSTLNMNNADDVRRRIVNHAK